MKHYVNWSSSYRHDSHLVTPYGFVERRPPADKQNSSPSASLPINYAAGKTKKVAWFVSNCNSRNGRHSYVEGLSRFLIRSQISARLITVLTAYGWRCDNNGPTLLKVFKWRHERRNSECNRLANYRYVFSSTFLSVLSLDWSTTRSTQLLTNQGSKHS